MTDRQQTSRESEQTAAPQVSSRAVKVASWVLRFVVAAQCVGLALPVLRDQVPSAINSYLWQIGGWSDDAVSQFDLIAAWSLVGLGAITLLFVCWPILILIGAWFLLTAMASWYMDSGHFPEVMVFAHAVRFMTPLMLIGFQHWPRRFAKSRRRVGVANTLLACAIGSTFVAHGYEAFCLHPEFIDYIIAAGDRLFAREVSQSDAEWLLRLIGLVDVVVGVCIIGCSPRVVVSGDVVKRQAMTMASRFRVGLAAAFAVAWLNTFREPADGVTRLVEWSEASLGVRIDDWIWLDGAAILSGLVAMWLVAHWRLLTIWLAAWGFVTAFSRVVAADWSHIDRVLVRAGNGGAAVALLLYWHVSRREVVSALKQHRRAKQHQSGHY